MLGESLSGPMLEQLARFVMQLPADVAWKRRQGGDKMSKDRKVEECELELAMPDVGQWQVVL